MFKVVKSKKVYQHIIEQVQEMIIDGRLKKGDKLPSERDLSEQFEVSRTSIREALRGLEIIGLVESKQGEGNFIKGTIEGNFFEPLSALFILNGGEAKEVLDMRHMIEIDAARLAAIRRTDEEAEELKVLVMKLTDAVDENESVKVDKQIHYKIAEITKNSLMINIFSTISALMEGYIRNARARILKENDTREELVRQHADVCYAIIDGDHEKASYYMKFHLDYINKIYNNDDGINKG